jgi:hypothetical protein
MALHQAVSIRNHTKIRLIFGSIKFSGFEVFNSDQGCPEFFGFNRNFCDWFFFEIEDLFSQEEKILGSHFNLPIPNNRETKIATADTLQAGAVL